MPVSPAAASRRISGSPTTAPRSRAYGWANTVTPPAACDLGHRVEDVPALARHPVAATEPLRAERRLERRHEPGFDQQAGEMRTADRHAAAQPAAAAAPARGRSRRRAASAATVSTRSSRASRIRRRSAASRGSSGSNPYASRCMLIRRPSAGTSTMQDSSEPSTSVRPGGRTADASAQPPVVS